ncbi:MAG TPA: hypothetical protein PLO66_05900 [Bacteroidales bacterium]|nr:hypothetical protein [Bacteroidales bacterium]
MKNIRVALFGILILSSLMVFAQKTKGSSKPFIAEITYKIDYVGNWDPAVLAQQPKELKVYVYGNKMKTVIDLSGMGYITNIQDGDDTTSIALIDIPAYQLKKYIKTTKEKILENLEEIAPRINYIDSSKEIAGYKVYKAEYIVKDEFGDPITTVVWYSPEINDGKINAAGDFPGLKGFPMEYITTQDEGSIIFSVGEVKTKKVKIKETDFLIPTDFEELTEEEAKELFGGE